VGLTTPHSKKLIDTKVEKRKKLDRFNDDGGRWRQIKKMEGYCSTGQSPQRAVVPVEEEEEEEGEEGEEEEEEVRSVKLIYQN
jgi:hypothetical protein